MANRVKSKRQSDRQTDRQQNDAGVQTVAQKTQSTKTTRNESVIMTKERYTNITNPASEDVLHFC